jgi:thiamine monophosphate kinase
MPDEVPMAMIGVVPTKVTAEGGAIKPGDLLVTSSKRGYAMKGTDHTQMMGAIIGKALGHLDSGTGVMEVLVSLQ